MRISTKILCALFLSATVVGCGFSFSDDDEDEESSNETAAEDLPAGIGEIGTDGINSMPDIIESVNLNENSDSDSASFDTDGSSLEIDDSFSLNRASRGISFGSGTSKDGLSGKGSSTAFGACRLVNRARGFLHFPAAADARICELRAVLGSNTDFYDGAERVIDFLDDGEKTRYKFKITGTADEVSEIETWICFEGVQSRYIKKTIANGQTTIFAKAYEKPDNPQVDEFRGIVNATGSVNGDGEFDDVKTIISNYSNNFSDGTTNYVKEVIRQSYSNIQYTGVMDQSNNSPERFLAFFRILDENTVDRKDGYDLANIGMGRGALLYSNGNITVTQGWDEDAQVDNDQTIVSKVAGRINDLPEDPNQETLTFTGEEIYDCAGEALFTVSFDTINNRVKQKKGIALQNDGGDGEFGDEEDGDDGDGGYEICEGYELPQNSYIECGDFDKTTL